MVVYKGQKPVKFASFHAGFRQLLQESRYGEEV